ncbi:hypothetical protein NIES932_25900 [Raphidiopsis curvata NIES-932]|nr:hypothetical protein NIES932_25900 [Raphidiopsis curvata NIES-932]
MDYHHKMEQFAVKIYLALILCIAALLIKVNCDRFVGVLVKVTKI